MASIPGYRIGQLVSWKRGIFHNKLVRGIRNASNMKQASQPMSFPCLDHLEKKTEQLSSGSKASDNENNVTSLDTGPEPVYSRVQTGFELFKSKEPIFLDNGGFLPEYQIAYETWGTLNETKDNAILIHTGLSASSHAKSQPQNPKPGWWENFIGPGKYLDTDKYYVICTNVLGSCYGSTGPSSKDPLNGDYYGTRFPIITINDMVRVQRELVRNHLDIPRLHASVGASMGGMQSLAYAWEFPLEVDKIVSISGCARSHPYSIAMRHTQRQVLMNDPNWKRGFYYDSVPPHIGMKLAREIATITYRSGPEWESRFGRNRADESKPPALCPDFLIETYLDHAGEKFCLQYDANSLIFILKAMDLFDLSHSYMQKALDNRNMARERFCVSSDSSEEIACPETPYEEVKKKATTTPEEALRDLKKGMEKLKGKDVLVIGVESDILFPVFQQREIRDVLTENAGCNVTYIELGTDISMYGHDSFLLRMDHIGNPVKEFLL